MGAFRMIGPHYTGDQVTFQSQLVRNFRDQGLTVQCPSDSSNPPNAIYLWNIRWSNGDGHWIIGRYVRGRLMILDPAVKGQSVTLDARRMETALTPIPFERYTAGLDRVGA